MGKFFSNKNIDKEKSYLKIFFYFRCLLILGLMGPVYFPRVTELTEYNYVQLGFLRPDEELGSEVDPHRFVRRVNLALAEDVRALP